MPLFSDFRELCDARHLLRVVFCFVIVWYFAVFLWSRAMGNWAGPGAHIDVIFLKLVPKVDP